MHSHSLRMSATHGDLPIGKHEVNIIRNLNIHKLQGIGGGAGQIQLLLESETGLTPTSRHKIPPLF
jgi:hypothetical protein